VAVFSGLPAEHVTIPGSSHCSGQNNQLSLLLLMRWEISTVRSVVNLFGCGVKAGMTHSTFGLNLLMAGKSL